MSFQECFPECATCMQKLSFISLPHSHGSRGYSDNRDAASFFRLLSQQFLGKLNNERTSVQFSEEYHRQECKNPPGVARLMALPREEVPLPKFYLFWTKFYLLLSAVAFLRKKKLPLCKCITVSRTFRLILVALLETE